MTTLSNTLTRLQIQQREHDEKYPVEITHLSNHHKICHMALHYCKYGGQLYEELQRGNKVLSERAITLVTDSLIITLACANMFNLRLADTLDSNENYSFYSLTEYCRDLARQLIPTFTSCDFIQGEYIMIAGRIAKACEAIDHLEALSYCETLSVHIVSMAKLLLSINGFYDLPTAHLIEERRASVQQRNIFHNHFREI